MGWWDSFDRSWNGHHEHLGQRPYDRYLLDRMVELATMVGHGGTPVVYLTVPWIDPAPLPNGEGPPAATPSRHREVNSLLARAVQVLHGKAHLFDIAPYVTPARAFSGRRRRRHLPDR